MIDLILASLVLIVVILLFIIALLTFYIISEHRKTTIIPWKTEKRVVVPLLTLKSNDRSSGDHCNSATLTSTHKRMTKRLRHRVNLWDSPLVTFLLLSRLEHYSFVLKILKDFFSPTVIPLLNCLNNREIPL